MKIVSPSLFPKKFKLSTLFCGTLTGLITMTALPSIAEEVNTAVVVESDSTSYDSAFFEQYLPQNALEMISRLPGFSFDRGLDARGFGGNAGNVLIDGARPTSKSGGLEGALIRIPAAQVARIEIIRGGISSGEAAGQSIVANVIRHKDGTNGTWAMKFRQTSGTDILPNLEAAITTTLGQWNTSFDTDIGGRPEYRTAIIESKDAQGQHTDSVDEIFNNVDKWAFFNGEGSRPLADGKLTLNARLGGYNGHMDINRDTYNNRDVDGSSPDEQWQLDYNEKSRVAELGIDWTKTFSQWKLRLIGLGLVKDIGTDSQSNDIDEDGVASNSRSLQDTFKTEFVGRTTLALVGGDSFKPEFGLEIAKNRLDSKLKSYEAGLLQASDSNDNVLVEEVRAELFATFSYQLDDKLSFSGGLTSEFSQIKVFAEEDNQQSFQFIKPRISSTYQINDDSLLTVELEHRVGQLDFNDFATSNEVSDGVTTTGNSNLMPDQTTEFTVTYDWSFSERGSLKVKAFYEWRKDILEQVVVSTDFDDDGEVVENYGLGNAGDAKYWGVITELNLPLDFVLPNGLIEIKHRYRDSEFYDSIINANRTINGYTPNFLTMELRQDLVEQKIAWGLEYWGSFTNTRYRVNEMETLSGNKRIRFFVETTRFFGLKAQLEVTHLNRGHYKRSRYFYVDNRIGASDGSQISRRLHKPEIKLSFFGIF